MDLSKILLNSLSEVKALDTEEPIHPIYEIGGFSGTKIRKLLNKILSHGELKYVEVGVLFGSTFIPAICGNNLKKAYAVDNWSEFGVRREFFIQNCKDYLDPAQKIELIEKNIFKTALKDFNNTKFNVYFYDGNHETESQYKALDHMINIGALEDEFIFIVDDYGWDGVKEGTQKAIKNLNLKILHEEELGVPISDSENTRRKNWWEGLYASVLKK